VEPTPTEYLEWIWEIPISPNVVSVGYVSTGAATKAKREQGISVEDIFKQQLIKFPRFEQLLQEVPLDPPNVVYARLRPRGIFSTFLLGLFLGAFRASAWAFYQLCKRLTPAAAMQG
jgi:hypothetical protein